MSVYAFSDLHGEYTLWQKIKEFINPDDTIYCLGDCVDRGPDGWKIIKEALDMPNLIYIRGNHDQFILDWDIHLWTQNGGAPTIEAALSDSPEERERIKQKLQKTSLIDTYINTSGKGIVMCHAGFDPELIQLMDEDALMWGRQHISRSWPKTWENNDMVIVHGHTPVQYLKIFMQFKEEKDMDSGAYWYCGGRKCCIDQGSFASGKALLLDLDTFEEHLFTTDV